MPRTKTKKTVKTKEKPPGAEPPQPEAQPETQPETQPEPKGETGEKIVYIGQKPVKNYVVACLTSFNAGSTKIVLKARGRAICKAVDTFELLRRMFVKDAQLQGISISTEEVTREGNRKANVSAIEISIVKL
jgi:DNA-binding protein